LAVGVSLLAPPAILRAAHQPLFAFAPAESGFLLVLAPSPGWNKLDEKDNRGVFSELP
jgi:hypothetical protein